MFYILKIVEENPYITTIEIANELKVKRETTSRNISKMKKLGLIERVDEDKGSYWSIIKKQKRLLVR